MPLHMIYINIYIWSWRFEKVLWWSHFSFTKKQEFWKKLLLLYIKEGFTKRFFPSVIIYILTTNTTDRHRKCAFNHGGECRTLNRRDLLWLISRCCLNTRVNLCGYYFIKIYHGLRGWYVLTVLNSTSYNEIILKP